MQAVLGNRIVVENGLDVLRLDEQIRRDEPARAGIQWLVELAVEFLPITQLQAGKPLGTQFVDAVLPITRTEVEYAVAAEVVGQAQAQSQVIGAGALLAGVDDQRIAELAALNAIFHALEIVQAIEGAHVLLQVLQIQRFTEWLADMPADHRIADLRVVLHPNSGDDRCSRVAGARKAQCRIATGGDAHFGKTFLQSQCGTVAGIDQLFGAGEVGGAVSGQWRLDQKVLRLQGGQLRFGVAAGHHGGGLVEHVDYCQQFLARLERRADVHHDQAVDAHVARHVHRDVVDHAAIHQQAAVQLHRCEHGRNRHAGANHLGQVAAAKDHLFIVGNIRGHRTEGDRQLVEVAGVAGVHQQALEQQREVLPLNHAQRQAEAAVVAEAELLLDEEITVVLLAAVGDVLARRIVGQHLLPVEGQCQALEFGNAVACCV